jgi:hypothetical protein
MLRTISGTTEFLKEAKMLDELTKASGYHHSSKSLSSEITREVIVDMYKLGLRITLHIINLFYGNARFRVAFWEKEREEVLLQCTEMDRLRTKMFYSYILVLST